MKLDHDASALLPQDHVHPPLSIERIIDETPIESMTARVVASLRELIDHSVTSAEHDDLHREAQRLEAARIAESSAAADLDQARARLERRKELLDRLPRPGLARSIIYLICAAIGFTAEFVLTWYTLPWALSLDETNLLGILLAAAPATAIVALDIALLRLIEQPWRRQKKTPGAMRAIAIGAMVAFMAAVSVLNVVMVWHLADAREEASRVRGAVALGESPTIDWMLVNPAIRSVSLMVAVSGGVFMLLGLESTSRFGRRRRVRREVAQLAREKEAHEKRYAGAAVECAALAHDWPDRAAARARARAEMTRSHLVTVLERALERPPAQRTPSEVVRMMLASIPGVTDLRPSIQGLGGHR